MCGAEWDDRTWCRCPTMGPPRMHTRRPGATSLPTRHSSRLSTRMRERASALASTGFKYSTAIKRAAPARSLCTDRRSASSEVKISGMFSHKASAVDQSRAPGSPSITPAVSMFLKAADSGTALGCVSLVPSRAFGPGRSCPLCWTSTFRAPSSLRCAGPGRPPKPVSPKRNARRRTNREPRTAARSAEISASRVADSLRYNGFGVDCTFACIFTPGKRPLVRGVFHDRSSGSGL